MIVNKIKPLQIYIFELLTPALGKYLEFFLFIVLLNDVGSYVNNVDKSIRLIY